MSYDGATMSTMVTTQKAMRVRRILPLSFLVLTCCITQVEAGARQHPEERGKSTVAAVAAERLQGVSHSTASIQLSTSPGMNNVTGTKVAADAVEEGRRLLSQTPSKAAATKPKDKGKASAKRLDASAEEEEEDEEEDEEADEEATTGKGSAKGGAATGSRLKSIQSDFDPALRADLKEVTARGSVLTVAVSLTFQGDTDRNELAVKGLGYCSGGHTWVTDYESGKTFRCQTISGFQDGEIKSGETKNLRLTFEIPKESKNAKSVGITLYHLGTFDDVKLGSSGGSLSSKPTGSSKTEDIEEEDEEDEEDVEEEDSKGLTKKKGAKKAAKKGAKKGAK